MHPLTIFPSLLTYVRLSPFLVRLPVGFLRLFAGLEKSKTGNKVIAVFDIVSSILLIVGLYTQVAALASIVLIFIDYYSQKKAGSLSREKKALTVVMVFILLSLLFTGPGFLAFDWPL